jgi:hypothetical protein
MRHLDQFHAEEHFHNDEHSDQQQHVDDAHFLVPMIDGVSLDHTHLDHVFNFSELTAVKINPASLSSAPIYSNLSQLLRPNYFLLHWQALSWTPSSTSRHLSRDHRIRVRTLPATNNTTTTVLLI